MPKYSLSEAITNGYVEANITGRSVLSGGTVVGVSAGSSIILEIHRLVDYTIEIEVIPKGTLLMASDGAQNMAIQNLQGYMIGPSSYVVQDKIILTNSIELNYLFTGYCVNFSLPNPTGLTTFFTNGMANADILAIYNVLNQLPTNATGVSAIQTAIFVVTDNISQSELSTRFPSGVSEIENARTILEAAGIDISTKRLFT
jgi:hypothetical protein